MNVSSAAGRHQHYSRILLSYQFLREKTTAKINLDTEALEPCEAVFVSCSNTAYGAISKSLPTSRFS